MDKFGLDFDWAILKFQDGPVFKVIMTVVVFYWLEHLSPHICGMWKLQTGLFIKEVGYEDSVLHYIVIRGIRLYKVKKN